MDNRIKKILILIRVMIFFSLSHHNVLCYKLWQSSGVVRAVNLILLHECNQCYDSCFVIDNFFCSYSGKKISYKVGFLFITDKRMTFGNYIISYTFRIKIKKFIYVSMLFHPFDLSYSTTI